MQKNTSLIFIILGICIAVFLLLIVFFFSFLTPSQVPLKDIPSPTPIPLEEVLRRVNSPSLETIPTNSPAEGGGIDMENTLVQKSLSAINKLAPNLPYQKDVTLSTGLPVTILIPDKSLQSNAWTLTVQIFNIDYEVTHASSNYPIIKSSFQEAAAIVFAWMESNNVNPNDVLIQWGDRAFIQEAAEGFLKKE